MALVQLSSDKMEKVGDRLTKGGLLLVGFIILVIVLSSLPSGDASSSSEVTKETTAEAPVAAPQQRIPSSIRAEQVERDPAPTTYSARPETRQDLPAKQKLRRSKPMPEESPEQMNARVRKYLQGK